MKFPKTLHRGPKIRSSGDVRHKFKKSSCLLNCNARKGQNVINGNDCGNRSTGSQARKRM